MAFRYSRRKSSVFRSGARMMTQDLDFRPLFTAMDRDCNGFIDRDELRATMWDIGMHVTDRELDMMMTVAGVVVKDHIFYEDFVKMMGGTVGRSQRKLMMRTSHGRKMSDMSLLVEGDTEDKTTQAMRVAFASFDHDGDGMISTSETNFTLTSLGMKIQPDDLSRLFKTIDKNGDGLISFDEFRVAMLDYEEATCKRVFLPPPVSGVDDVNEGSRCASLVHVIFDGAFVVNGNEVVLPVGGLEAEGGFDEEGEDDDGEDDDEVEYVGENQQRFMREAFRIFDKDKDGFLNERDLRCTMCHLGLDLSRDDVVSMLIVLGIRPGGKIPFDTFRNMWFGRTEKTLENICLRGAMSPKALQHRPSIFAASEITDWDVPQEFKYHVDQKKHYHDLLNFVLQEFSDELNEKFKDSTEKEDKPKLPVLSESQENLAEEIESQVKPTETCQPFKTTERSDESEDRNIYDTVYDGDGKRERRQHDSKECGMRKATDKSRTDTDGEVAVEVHRPLRSVDEAKQITGLPFVASPRAMPQPAKPSTHERPFLSAISQSRPTVVAPKEAPAERQSANSTESLKSIRRQEFLDLSKMTDSGQKAKNLSRPFALDVPRSPCSSSTSGFSLSPVYDVPYPSPSKKPRSIFLDTEPLCVRNAKAGITAPSQLDPGRLPFATTLAASTPQPSYSCYSSVTRKTVEDYAGKPSSFTASKPFMSTASSVKQQPYSVDWRTANMAPPVVNQYHVLIPDSYYSSVFHQSSNLVQYPGQSKYASQITGEQDQHLDHPSYSSTTRAGKSILHKPRAHYAPGESHKLSASNRINTSAYNQAPTGQYSTPASKSVNFKLSTEDGIKIMSCGTKEIKPDRETKLPFMRTSCEKMKLSSCGPSYNLILHKPYGRTRGIFSAADQSSVSSEDSDLRSSTSSRRDQSDSSADNTLTLLTIKQTYTSRDESEKESTSTVIGRIDRTSQTTRRDVSPRSEFVSSVSQSLQKSDPKLLSKLSRSDIPLFQVPLSKTTVHFVPPAQTTSPNQMRLDVLTTYGGASPAQGQNKVSAMISNRLSSAVMKSDQAAPIKLNKLSHFEGVMPTDNSVKDGGESIITLEKFAWKDRNLVKPGTFLQHERTKTKTDNKVVFRTSLKMKSATTDGKDKLTLSEKVATASKTPIDERLEGSRSVGGKKVVLSRLDLTKGDDLIASGLTMDTYKLYKEPFSPTGMRWNAVRRMMQHMCTDRHGNKHFFFVGSLFPKRSTYSSKDYAWKAFKVFDKNLDGFISWFELNSTFRDLGMKKTNFELCCIMDENDSNGDGVIDYFEFCRMFRRRAYEFCAKRAAELYEVHSTHRHEDEDILVRTKFKYLTNHPETPGHDYLEQLRTVFKMADVDSTGKARLSDLGKNLESLSGIWPDSDLFKGHGQIADSRKIGFDEFYRMVYDSHKEKADDRSMSKSRPAPIPPLMSK